MIRLSDLTIQYSACPAGITEPIELCWVMESDERNVKQESYQIQIWNGEILVYDSGCVESSQSAHVMVTQSWDSIRRYRVRLCVTANGQSSQWVERSFVTGFQRKEEWKGKFISAEPEADKGESYGTMLRKEFCVAKPLKEAFLLSSAHGIYHAFLNGFRVSADELSPGWTSYHKRLLYQTYDVTGLLQQGENAIGIMLGAGWYKGMMGYKHTRNNYGTRTAFGGQLILRYEDGSEDWVCSDESWKGTKSPVLFSEIYGGEIYDARQEQFGWMLPGFDDGTWADTEMVERDVSTLVPQQSCPVRVQERFHPVALFTTPDGDRVLDFGQNMAGWCEIAVENATAGAVVELEFFEVLNKDGNVYTENLRGIHQILRYICKGGETETYHPFFTFQGFQYAKIISYPGEPSVERFTACVVHSDLKETLRFECSNPFINQLQHNIRWGMKGNFIDIPMDCPQRDERLGWTGDVQAFARTSSYLMNTDAFYRKWLGDVAADQTAEGAVTHVVPDILTGHMEGDWLLSQSVQGGASGWGDVAVILPWTLYQIYGDKEVLRSQMDSMLKWVQFMNQHSKGCLFEYGAQFGDWLALDAVPGSYKGATPDAYTSAAYYCASVGLVAKMLHILGREEESERYHSLANTLNCHFHSLFFRPDGSLTIQTQTAHVLALAFGLVPKEYRERIAARLRELLAENNGHLATGFMGTPYLMRALSENGGLEEAYALLMKDDFPSWLYQVKAGATTVWEHWDGRKPDGSMWSPDMNSFNHYAYGSVGEWLYRTVCGLEIDEERPGYDHFYLKPQIGGGLTWARLSFDSIHGEIVSDWSLSGDIVTLKVKIPANTTADILLTQAKTLLDTDGLSFIGKHANAGSGVYSIQYKI